MVQTPQQRRANAKFAKGNEARMGKSFEDIKQKTREVPKPPISPFWIVLLAFILIGGLVFDPISRMLGF